MTPEGAGRASELLHPLALLVYGFPASVTTSPASRSHGTVDPERCSSRTVAARGFPTHRRSALRTAFRTRPTHVLGLRDTLLGRQRTFKRIDRPCEPLDQIVGFRRADDERGRQDDRVSDSPDEQHLGLGQIGYPLTDACLGSR